MSEAVNEEVEVQDDPLGIGVPQAQIDAWKKEHGKVFFQELPDGSQYIVRALKRLEYKELSSAGKLTQSDMEEMVYRKCVLWPNPDQNTFTLGAAGTPATLAEIIMHLSNFGVNAEPQQL
jgi:hypothetical protein